MPTKLNVSPARTSFVLDAALVARLHTCFAYTAFALALVLGCVFHYKKIVKNGVAGYPEEWFPSVSATIGDWYPERNLFQIVIALTSGPRLGLVLFQYYLHYATRPSLSTVVFVFGLLRTLSCGGWVYITSSDDHDVHDFVMILYMACNIPWMLGGVACTSETSVKRKRTAVATAFFVSIIPLIYFFIQHKVHRVPGAYTHYSFFEWGLIVFDVLYDAVAEQEFREANLQISLGPISTTNGSIDPKPISIDSDISILTAGGNSTEKAQAVNGDIITKPTISISPQLRLVVSFVSDVYLSYIFWSIFTALVPTLFYFSVWELGIAGHELALLVTLSPVSFVIRPVFRWMRTRQGQAVGHVVGMTAVGAAMLKGPGARLAAVAPAVSVGVLRASAEWSGEEVDMGYESLVAGFGLTVAALSKHLNYSNNPVWPFVDDKSMETATSGLVLGLIAVYEQYSRSPTPSLLPQQKQYRRRISSLPGSGIATALPLGSLIFTLHNLFADPSTLIAWSWTGFQNGKPRGPVPHLHGSFTLIAQCVGLLIPVVLCAVSTESETKAPSASYLHLLSQPWWFAYGAMSAYTMYACKDSTGYAGGLGLAVFSMSIFPGVLGRAAACGRKSPVGTWAGAMGVYCALTVASVLTVAYAFVPGGVYFRERTGGILIIQMACLALAFDWSHLRSSPLALLGGGGNSNLVITRSAEAFSKALLVVVSVLSVLGTLYRWPSAAPMPHKPGPRVFNAGIWTLHFGIDNSGRESQRGVAKLISDMELDVVGFLESDLHRITFGHRDLTRLAVEELGYHVDIGPGPNAHTWGAAILSKFPIINSTHHLLPSPRGELAPAIEAVLDVYGTEITVVVSHNGQEEDPLDRELQSKELGRIMAASYPRPVIFLGYVVTKPHAERPSPYKYLVEDGRVHDIDDEDQDRWCEYILYRGVYRTAYARVSRGTITDTELQIGQFTLPRHGTGVTNETREARYLRSFKESLPEHHWFPMAYYGNENSGGVNGHFYHVFGTPLYYDFPEGAVL